MLDLTKNEDNIPAEPTRYDDHSPLPWVVDDNREGFEGLVTVFDADGKAVMAFGDMEDCDWRDICDAYTVAHRVNCYDDLLAACRELENALAFALAGRPLRNSDEIIARAQAALARAGE